jgi:diguanylate cyclase (GGDEF)-like protein
VSDEWVALLVEIDGQWRVAVQDARAGNHDAPRALEPIAIAAAERLTIGSSTGLVAIDGFECLPVRAAGKLVGVLLVHTGDDASARRDRQALGRVLALMGIAIRNVALFAQIREHSLRDSMTGWFNYGHGIATLNNELRRARRARTPVAVIMFDVDDFKRLNDRDGHQAGDSVLQDVTQRIDDILRTSDIKCRYGGDEFLVMLPDTPPIGAFHVAETMRLAVESLPGPNGDRHVTASFGVAWAHDGETDGAALIARADRALYDAKRAGRNCVCAAVDPHSTSQTEANTIEGKELQTESGARQGTLPTAAGA